MRGNVFINYRREDSAGWTGRLYDRLARSLPASRIFIDVDNIPPGEDFALLLDQQVARCDAFLAIIGPSWLDEHNATGKRRIDNPADFVRIEIASALRRAAINVIPVLVDGAQMPSANDLPQDIQSLAHRNALEISASRFHRDAGRLLAAVKAALPWRVRHRRVLRYSSGAIAIVATVAVLYSAILSGEITTAFGLEKYIRPAAKEWATLTYVDKTNPAVLVEFIARYAQSDEAKEASNWFQYSSLRAWSKVEGSSRRNDIADFLQTFPTSNEAPEARRRLDELDRAQNRSSNTEHEMLSRFHDCPQPRCPEMIVLPPGQYTMGSPEIERTVPQDAHEGPRQRVTIPKAFAVGRFEVSVAEFRAFVEETGHEMGDECIGILNPSDASKVWEDIPGRNHNSPGFTQHDDHPVVCVSWHDAIAYVRWLGSISASTYRLLTEAEWEYAARAGSADSYSFGDNESLLCQFANGADRGLGRMWRVNRWCADGQGQGTARVGNYLPNLFGLRDVHGNVHEWVEDCYHTGYQNMPAATKQAGAAWAEQNCPARVIRGGCWAYPPSQLRSARREAWEPFKRSYCVGFRVAKSLPG